MIDGKYRVERILGEGGMGFVIAATHLQLGSAVAIKLVRAEAARHAEALARFQREARVAAQLRSNHVARVTDVGALPEDQGGLPYMVLEYLEGTDLTAVIKQRAPLPVDEAVTYLVEACEAVDEAHGLGIVHRDLKPGNLFLARRARGRPTIKVLDFGISSVAAGEADVRLTNTGTVMGTPRYMAPEQMLDAHRADQRSDIWALGVILYELLTGTVPFPGNTFGQIHERILTTEAPSLRTRRPDVPPELDAIVLRCLRKPAAERFASVAELEQGLRPFMATAPSAFTQMASSPALPPLGAGETEISVLDRTGAATTGVMQPPRPVTVPAAPVFGSPPVTTPTTPMSWDQASAPVLAAPPPARAKTRIAVIGAIGAAAASLLALGVVLLRGPSHAGDPGAAAAPSASVALPALSAPIAPPVAATPSETAAPAPPVASASAAPSPVTQRPPARVAAPAPKPPSPPPPQPPLPAKIPPASGLADERH
ncbi:MAG: serine/threonine-protein kinase [Byssovorax sp.]